MQSNHKSFEEFAKDTLIGAAGGLIGTVALWLADSATQKWAPAAQAPMRAEPGAYMVTQAQARLPATTWSHIPDRAEKAAAVGLSFCYGSTFGAIYGAMRPRGGNALVDGVILGTLCWAAGYLGWLPASGLMPPVWRQKPAQVAGPLVQHALYGVAAVGAYDLIKEHV